MNILLAVCGKTPQIITETLYALWEQGTFPDSIRIITTRAGKEALYSALLDPVHGMVFAFCRDYEIDPNCLAFSWKDILVPRGKDGAELEDIDSEEHSALFLSMCLEEAFHLSADRRNTLFFSIAGGRKTMGASLTLAAQYYGRAQDHLFHVLVSSEFESSPNFYYIPRKPRTIALKNSQGEEFFKSTKYATISLVNIPFFSIREHVSQDMLTKPISLKEIVAELQYRKKPTLRIHVIKTALEWQGRFLKLSTAQFALYLFFVLHKKHATQPAEHPQEQLEIHDIIARKNEIAALYRSLQRVAKKDSKTPSDTGILALTHENCRSYLSKIKKAIEKNFGSLGMQELAIASFGKAPDTTYALPIAAHHIEIIDEVGVL